MRETRTLEVQVPRTATYFVIVCDGCGKEEGPRPETLEWCRKQLVSGAGLSTPTGVSGTKGWVMVTELAPEDDSVSLILKTFCPECRGRAGL